MAGGCVVLPGPVERGTALPLGSRYVPVDSVIKKHVNRRRIDVQMIQIHNPGGDR